MLNSHCNRLQPASHGAAIEAALAALRYASFVVPNIEKHQSHSIFY